VSDGIVSEKENKPILDEQTLAKVLEAAYVLQEHNRELQQLELGFELKWDKIENQDRSAAASERPAPLDTAAQADYTSILAQIVEIQQRIQVSHLDLQSAISLVAERVLEIGHGGGAAIGILKGETVQYRAVAGRRALPAGSEVPLEKALCVSSIRTGQVLRCVDVNPELLLDSEECRRRGIQSLITVPVFHEGAAVGGLELYYSELHGFTEQDVHTCQLMAGLITEALARDKELTWKKSLANERSVMMQALEKLKPNLTALVDKHANNGAGSSYTCSKCGHHLVADEQFCGQCGTPRTADETNTQSNEVRPLVGREAKQGSAEFLNEIRASEETQKDFEPIPFQLSLDEMVDSLKEPPVSAQSDLEVDQTDDPSTLPLELLHEELLEEELLEGDSEQNSEEQIEEQAKSVEEDSEPEVVALAKPAIEADWSSALSAREYFEKLAGSKRSAGIVRFWNARRGDIYLAIAVIVVVCVIRWGIWSSHPVSATDTTNTASTAHHKASADADLSFFDRMLISLGLAEAPETPDDPGNPSIQVWIDLRTALYYCPGADLYGKTATGKYATQRNAQLDQFQPAYRKVCK